MLLSDHYVTKVRDHTQHYSRLHVQFGNQAFRQTLINSGCGVAIDPRGAT